MTKVHLQDIMAKRVAKQHGGEWGYKRPEYLINAYTLTLDALETGQLLSALSEQQKRYRHSGTTGDALEMNRKLVSKLMGHGDLIYEDRMGK